MRFMNYAAASVALHALILSLPIPGGPSTTKADAIEVSLLDEPPLVVPFEQRELAPQRPLSLRAPMPASHDEASRIAGPQKPGFRSAESTPPQPAVANTVNASEEEANTEDSNTLIPVAGVADALDATAVSIAIGRKGLGDSLGTSLWNGIGQGNPLGTMGGFGESAGSGSDSVAGGGSVLFGSSFGPKFLHRDPPQYPYSARRQKLEGMVVLMLAIGADGSLQNIEVCESSNEVFVRPSIEAIKKSSFFPAVRNGVPITVRALLTIRYALND
jgi:protein TonB